MGKLTIPKWFLDVLRHIPGSCRGKWRSPDFARPSGEECGSISGGSRGRGKWPWRTWWRKASWNIYIIYNNIYIYIDTYIYNYIWYVYRYRYIDTGWWFGTFFFHILGIIIPTDELIFFRVVGIPPTSIDIWYVCIYETPWRLVKILEGFYYSEKYPQEYSI